MKIKNLLYNPIISGSFLVLATLLALLVANSPLADLYRDFIHAELTLGLLVQDWFFGLKQSVHFWVNDVLMTVFFLLVGMEIKRELAVGELSHRATALQPVFAALGGVVVPVLFFMLVNKGQTDTQIGWAIPAATDIAFALGILALLGSRVPPALTILLAAIAILDDLVAILVIGIFYTHDLQPEYLLWGLGASFCLALLNYKNIQAIPCYILAGLVLWAAFYKTGLHPTLAGVVTAMALPVRGKENNSDGIIRRAPLLRLEYFLSPWVAFLIVPLFAFANAGLNLSFVQLSDFKHPLTAGIMVGLMLGKPIGIMLGLYLGHIVGLARKPAQMQWKNYTGIAVLCGIGFTMSLFIGDLAFKTADYQDHVKLGVLSASLCMAVLGWILCRVTLKKPLVASH